VEHEALAHQKAIAGIGELATWTTHELSGSEASPAIWTRRGASSITNSTTYRGNPAAVPTSTGKKSAAARTSASAAQAPVPCRAA